MERDYETGAPDGREVPPEKYKNGAREISTREISTGEISKEAEAAPQGQTRTEAAQGHLREHLSVVALVSQKGGAGKTTLAGHLAVEAERRGTGPVALIDADPQASLAAWWNERPHKTPFFAQPHFPRLGADLDKLAEAGIRLVIIDTPPAITHAIRQVIVFADLAVVPTRPSPHDLRAVGASVTMIEEARKPMIFVVNAAHPRARITAEAAIALSQHGTVAPVTIHQRTDFASSMTDGRTVMELDSKGRSAREISLLWQYIDGRLTRMDHTHQKGPVFTPEREGVGGPLRASRRVFGRRGDTRGDPHIESSRSDLEHKTARVPGSNPLPAGLSQGLARGTGPL